MIHLEDVLKTYYQDEYVRLDQDVLKMSWRRLLKTKTKDVFKTSSRRLHQDECLLGTWLICTSRNWKLSQSENLSKDAGLFLKISFVFRCFSDIFDIANQLPGFSNSRLSNVEDFLNVNIAFQCKYKYEYKRLFI